MNLSSSPLLTLIAPPQVSWRSFANIFGSDFMSYRQKLGFHWMVKMAMPCQLTYLMLQSFLLVALSAKLGMGSVFFLTSVWVIPHAVFLFLFADLPLSWRFIYLFSILPLMAFFMLVDLVGQVRV